MRKITANLLLSALLSVSFYGNSQQIVKGKIVDHINAQAIPGVTVVLKGTKTKAMSNDNGEYSIRVTSKNDTLQFISIGYEVLQIKTQGKTSVNVSLKPSASALDEVVVVAYGTQLKKDLTGSVGSANVEDMRKAPVVSFEEALAGRIAGVQVSSNDGQPGSMSNIVIRGGNSITQSNSPLYVIDGFPLENPDNNIINPDDIESIEVLKDASSTAIYGARGANGVVIIITKQGKIGAPVATYNTWAAYQQPTKQIPVMSAYEFVKYQNELSHTSASQLYFKDGKTLDSYKDVQGINWQDKVMQDAFMQNHNLAVRGGTTATKYSLSSSYLGQNGVVINGGYERYQGRFQIDQRIGKNFKVGVNTNYTYAVKNGQIANLTSDDLNNNSSGNSSSYLMYSAWGYRPVVGGLNNDDFFNDPFDDDLTSSVDLRVNPYINAKNAYSYIFTNSFYSNAFMEYSFLNNFKLRIRGGMTENNSRNERFNNSNTAAGNPATVYGSIYGINGSISNSVTRSFLNENLLTYTKVFNKKHRVDAIAGFTMQRNANQVNGYASILLPNESLGISGLDQGTVLSKESAASYSTLVSYLSRVNYSLSSKYIFEFSFRGDGSSKFSPKNRWGYFPSGAFAWKIGNEDFLKRSKTISAAKLRVSYGITGNNRVSDFAYLSVLNQEVTANSGNTNSGYYFNGTYYKGTVPTNVGNDQLKWERTASLDIGLDVGFFKDRINLVADYYHKKTTDLLLNASLPTSFGYLTAFKNIGVVANSGLEFSLNTTNIQTKNFLWTSSFNIAFNRNKILELNGIEPSITTRIVNWNSQFNNSFPYIALPGHNIALLYGYVFDGLYQLSDFDIQQNGSYKLKATIPDNGSNAVKPGHIRYKDINGDGVIDANDQTIIGNPNPKHIGGFTNNFRYKQFDVNVFLQWCYGNDVLNANRIVFEGSEGRQSLNMFKTYENRWSLDNQYSLLPVAGGYGPNVYSNRNVEDGSFLRLKTVSLGYNIPAVTMKKIGVQALRIHASAQNLITWTKYSGLDPEVSVRNSALTPGFDWSSYPRARTISFGLNLTF